MSLVESSEPVVEAAVRALAPFAVKEEERPTFDGKVHFYRTPNFSYPCLIVKQAQTSDARKNLAREAATILNVQERMRGTYRTPAFLAYYHENGLLILEWIKGMHAMEALRQGTKTLDKVLGDADAWLRQFAGNAEQQEICVGDLATYRQALKRYEAEKKELPKKYQRIAQCLQSRWKEMVTNSSPVSVITGDFSPIHLFYAENNAVYGIDFDAARTGTQAEEAGLFFGNLYYHVQFADFLRKKEVRQEIQGALEKGLFGGSTDLLCFPVGISYLLKAFGARYEGRKDEEERLLDASLRALRADKFNTDLLRF